MLLVVFACFRNGPTRSGRRKIHGPGPLRPRNSTVDDSTHALLASAGDVTVIGDDLQAAAEGFDVGGQGCAVRWCLAGVAGRAFDEQGGEDRENTIPVRSSMSHSADHDMRDSSRQNLTRCYHRKRARAAVLTLLHQVDKSTVLYR
jgi:hypothetical protein